MNKQCEREILREGAIALAILPFEFRHGEFRIHSKQGKYETIVELGGHIIHRYHFSKEEIETIEQIYERFLEAVVTAHKIYFANQTNRAVKSYQHTLSSYVRNTFRYDLDCDR